MQLKPPSTPFSRQHSCDGYSQTPVQVAAFMQRVQSNPRYVGSIRAADTVKSPLSRLDSPVLIIYLELSTLSCDFPMEKTLVGRILNGSQYSDSI